MPRRKVAIVTGDTLGRQLSGPGIRALELAKVLAEEHDVRLVSTVAANLHAPPIDVQVAITDDEVKKLEAWCDLFVFQGFFLARHPRLVHCEIPIVVDLYDPFHLEELEQTREIPADDRNRRLLNTMNVVNQQLARGDYFLCASAKQRDFWLGQLTGMGRLNAHTYEDDASLRSLIGVVPFGMSESRPTHDRSVLRGVVPGIGHSDWILLWGGGLYPWLDPMTLVRAVDRLRCIVPDVRLVFLAGRHPNPEVPPMPTTGEAKALTAELELHRHVFFVDHWVDYSDRHNYLLEADVGVSAHFDHIETQYSFRTRILDYIWAGLPVVTTGGDAMAELVQREHVGRVVPPDDVGAMAAALQELLQDPDALVSCRSRLNALSSRFHWHEVAKPLVDFCHRPRRAPDLAAGLQQPVVNLLLEAPTTFTGKLRRAVYLTSRSLRDDGWRTTAGRIVQRPLARLWRS